MKLPVLLRIYVNDKLQGVKQFTDQQIVVGRNAEVQLTLDDPGVSALHAIIEERDTGYYVSDLGSQSGTIKNGQKILDEKLESGDEIQIGPYRLQFFVGVPKPAAPPVTKPAAAEATVTPAENPAPATDLKPAANATPAPAAPPAPADTPTTKPSPSPSPAPAPATKSDEPPPLSAKSPTASEAAKTPAPSPAPETKSAPAGNASTPAPAPAAKPAAASVPAARASAGAQRSGTYAPPSKYADLRDIIKPGKGTVVEVIVAWKERIIASYHFSEKGTYTVGADEKCHIVVPLLGVARPSHPILRIDTWATVIVTQEMSGEYIQENRATNFSDLVRQGKIRGGAGGFELDVGQGEMARVGFMGNTLSLYIRYVPEAPKPLVAPILDLTASEVTGVILAIVVALILGLYMLIYSPSALVDEAKIEEPIRKATVVFNIPKPQKADVEVIKMDVEKPPEKKIVKVVEEKKVEQKVAPKTPEPKPNPGKAAEVKPFDSKNKDQKLTQAREQGAAVKTGPKDGANMNSEKKDPSKMGLLGAFGTKGTQSKLDKVYSGAGELQGMADSATGYAGASEDRAGDRIGGKLKADGASGKGKSTIGIAGVGTQGKGTGNYGYGTGGLGIKGNVEINLGGQEAEFEGTIDREAIRRVIQANRRAIKACYDKALNKNPDLYGKLVIEWDIGEQGRVLRAVSNSNSLGDTEVANCIIARLKTWRFPEPPPDQTARVLYPFVFTSQ